MWKKQFFSFCFQNFFDFWAKIFSYFRRKIFKKLSKLPSACPQEQLVALNFLKSFEPFWIFYRNFWHGSQNSIYVSRVKIALETNFLFFFSDFFRILSEKFFRLLAEKRQDFVKITFYVSRGKICGLIFVLSFESFPIFCRNHWHGSQNFIYESRLKIVEKTVFFRFVFRTFLTFERKFFQTSGEKSSKSCQNYLLRVHRNNLWL